MINKRIKIITFYELLKILRTPITVFFAVIFPILMITFMARGKPKEIIPNVVLLIILVHSLSNLPLTIFSNIKNKVIRGYAQTKLTKSEYLISVIIANFLFVLISLITLFIYSSIKFDLEVVKSFANIPFIIYNIFLLIVFSFFGILLGSLFKDQSSTLSISFLFYFGILFSSGAGIPLQYVPTQIQDVVKYSPFTQMLVISDNLYLAKSLDFGMILYVGLTCLIIITLSLLKFKWKEN